MRDNVRDVRLQVGRNVRRLRLLRGLSQEDLAELVGNNNKHIGQVERGEVNVGIDTLTAIAQGCSVSVVDLFRSDRGGAKTKVVILTRRDSDHVEESLRILARAKSARRRRKQKTPD